MVYTCIRDLTEKIDLGQQSVTVGKLILSPTRTYLPVLREVFEQHRKKIHGVIHCTGGGQTKPLKFIENVEIIKDKLFDLPPLFRLIQESSQTEWREMYQVFNMGHRMELYVSPRHADAIMQIAEKYGIESKIVGHVKATQGERVTVKSEYGTFVY